MVLVTGVHDSGSYASVEYALASVVYSASRPALAEMRAMPDCLSPELQGRWVRFL